MLRSVLRSTIRNVLRGTTGQEDGPLAFDLPLLNTLEPSKAQSSGSPAVRAANAANYSRATTATVEDHEGRIIEVPSNCARMRGARYVQNLITASEDMTNAGFIEQNGGSVTATELTTDGTTDSGVFWRHTITDDGSGAGGRTFVFSASIRLVSGTISASSSLQFRLQGSAVTQATAGIGYEVSSTAKRFSVSASTDASGTTVIPKIDCDDAVTLEITNWQLEEVTGNITHAPSEYVSTGVGTGGELFDSSSPVLGTGWSDNGDGTFTRTDAASVTSVGFPITVTADSAHTYAVQYSVSGISGGNYYPRWSNDGAGTNPTPSYATRTDASGTFVDLITPISGNDHIELRFGTNTVGTIEILSVKPLDAHGLGENGVVDGVKAFNYHNGNTVASTGVVTEAQGPAINSSTSQWVELDGASGTYVSMPDNAAASVTGDITLIAWVALDDWTPSAFNEFISKYNASGNERSYRAGVNSDGTITFRHSADGIAATDWTSTAATGFSDGTGHWLRITADVSAGEVTIFTSEQPLGSALSDLSWTQLGETISGSSFSIYDGTAIFAVGAESNGTTAPVSGKISRAVVIASTDPTATPVVDFNANDYEAGVTWESSGAIPTATVTNGGFDTDSDWTKGTGWSISGGTASSDGTQSGSSLLQQQRTDWIVGKLVKITFTQTERSAGQTAFTGSPTGMTRLSAFQGFTTTGTFSAIYQVTASTADIDITADANYVGSIDNVTAEYLPDLWTLNGTARAFSPFAAWADLPNSSGDYISTPDDVKNSPTDDFCTAFFGALDWQTPSSDETLSSKFQSGGVTFMLRNVSGLMRIDLSSTGGSETTVNATVKTSFQDGAMGGVMIAFDHSEGTITLYESHDHPFTPWNQITWVELEVITGASIAGTLFNGSTLWRIGAYNSGGTNGIMDGKAARAAIWKSTDFSVEPDAQWDARIHTPGVATATGADGLTYTLNGNVSIEQNIPSPWDASGPLGYLSEQAGTNLITYSEDFSNAAWAKTSITVSANSAVGPDGKKTVSTFTETTGTNIHGIGTSQVSVTSSSDYTMTFAVKKKSDRWFQLSFQSGEFGTNAYANFDFDTGSWGTVGSATTAHRPIALGGGWYEVSITAPATATAATARGYLFFTNNADGARAPSYTGATDSDVYVAYSQVEASSFPTTYIPTTSSSATRNADVLTYSAVGNAPYGRTQHLEYTPGQISTNTQVLSIHDGDSNEPVYIETGSDGSITGVVSSDGTNKAVETATNDSIIGVTQSITFASFTNDAQLYIDGLSQGAADTDVTPDPDPPTTIQIGANNASGAQPYGTIRNVKIFNKRLNDSQVATL